MHIESLNRKRKISEEENKIDRLMIKYQIESDLEYEKENINKRKQNKKKLEEIKKENIKNQLFRRRSSQKEKEDDKKYIEEYTKLLEEQENQRLDERKIISNKIKNYTNPEFYSKFFDVNDYCKRELQKNNEKNLSFNEKTYLIFFINQIHNRRKAQK